MNVLSIWINREPGIEFKGETYQRHILGCQADIHLELEYQHTVITWRLDWETVSGVFLLWRIHLRTSFENHALEFALWLSLVSLLMLLVCKLIFIEDFTNSFRTFYYTPTSEFSLIDLRTKVRCLTSCQKWMKLTDNCKVRRYKILTFLLKDFPMIYWVSNNHHSRKCRNTG